MQTVPSPPFAAQVPPPSVRESSRRARLSSFTPDLITAVKLRANIADVASAHVPLRRSGKTLIGLCPFGHPSKSGKCFSVDPERNSFRCWSCNRHGDVIDFVRELYGLDFPAAVQHLARVTGIDPTAGPDPELTAEARIRNEIAALDARIRELLQAAFIAVSDVLHALRQHHRRIKKRLHEMNEASDERFPGEWELAWSALVDVHERILRADAAYVLVGLVGFEDRLKFSSATEVEREGMIDEALEAGGVEGDRCWFRVGLDEPGILD